MNIKQWVAGTRRVLKSCSVIGSRVLEVIGEYHEASGHFEDVSQARRVAQLGERETRGQDKRSVPKDAADPSSTIPKR